MSMSTVVIISLAASVLLVIGGAVVMYMANLVKSAYDLKVQIAADVEARFAKMTDEMDKKSRWIKRDLIEEIEKIKAALETENARRFQALADPVNKSVEELEALIRNERREWVAAIERDRGLIAQLDSRVDFLRRDLKEFSPPPAPPPPPMPSPPAGGGELALAEAGEGADLAPVGSSDPLTMSQFLPDLGGRKR